jgi:serine/threonine-protein kinase
VSSPIQPGDVLDGKYRVERVLGEGGMGVVVAATHLELGQLVAMKFVLNEGLSRPDVVQRFIREARAAVRIRGQHVARVLDVGRMQSGAPYIVMEYLEGRDLEHVVREGPLPIDQAVDYVIQACDAMAEAHRLGIVHRDLKPANLFLATQPDGGVCVKVLDFGISKSNLDVGSVGGLTSDGALLGSPLYMSPEQMRSSKNVDRRSDIWSLGAVLFEFLAGKPPFYGDSVPGLIASILSDPPAPLAALRPEAPSELVAVVMRCLEKDPAQRFPDVAQLALALGPFAPYHAQLAVERVHRILGSIPPPPGSEAYSSGPPRSVAQPRSVAPPPSVAPARGAEPGQGATATGWGGGAETRSGQGRSNVWLIGAALGALALAGGGYALFANRTVPAPEPAPATATPPPPVEKNVLTPARPEVVPRVEANLPLREEAPVPKPSAVASTKAHGSLAPKPSAHPTPTPDPKASGSKGRLDMELIK